jgi:hypothetical protein
MAAKHIFHCRGAHHWQNRQPIAADRRRHGALGLVACLKEAV